jgi:hypothetical protein
MAPRDPNFSDPDSFLLLLTCSSIVISIVAAYWGRKFFLYVETGTILYCLGRYFYARKSMRP